MKDQNQNNRENRGNQRSEQYDKRNPGQAPQGFRNERNSTRSGGQNNPKR